MHPPQFLLVTRVSHSDLNLVCQPPGWRQSAPERAGLSIKSSPKTTGSAMGTSPTNRRFSARMDQDSTDVFGNVHFIDDDEPCLDDVDGGVESLNGGGGAEADGHEEQGQVQYDPGSVSVGIKCISLRSRIRILLESAVDTLPSFALLLKGGVQVSGHMCVQHVAIHNLRHQCRPSNEAMKMHRLQPNFRDEYLGLLLLVRPGVPRPFSRERKMTS